jgi:hypothetical protein
LNPVGSAAVDAAGAVVARTAASAALLQLPCTFHWLPFENLSSVLPYVHAHLSAFSSPEPSYQALICGYGALR